MRAERFIALSLFVVPLACVERSPERGEVERRASEPAGDTTSDSFDDAGAAAGSGGAMARPGAAGAAGSGGTAGGAHDASAGGSSGTAGGGTSGSVGTSDASGGAGGGEPVGGRAGSLDAGAGAGGAGGSASEVDPSPRSCNSSDGSGCEEGEVCLDSIADDCLPGDGVDCIGLCAPTLPLSSCEAGLAQCVGSPTCSDPAPECSPGLVPSFEGDCHGPCVPADCCACSSALDCWLGDVSCDLASGRCVPPAAPEPRCLLPFDPGSCLASIPAFAFVDGACTETSWGGCEGNDNRFNTLEECMRRCEGLPQQGECPAGRVATVTCLQCGAGGGCVDMTTVCAETCETIDDCPVGTVCSNATCIRGCF
jgi:hypothetical protein